MDRGPRKLFYTIEEYNALPKEERARLSYGDREQCYYDKNALRDYTDEGLRRLGNLDYNDKDCIAAFVIRAKREGGSGGGPRASKSLQELETDLCDGFGGFNQASLPCSITLIEKKAFTQKAKEKTREVILNFLAKNFSLIKLKIQKSDSVGSNILDEATSNKINSYLKRNKRLHLNYKKIQVTFWSCAAGLGLGSLFFFSLPTLITNTIFLFFMRWAFNQEFNQKITKNSTSTAFLFYILLGTVFMGGIEPTAILGVTAAIVGTLTDYTRKKYLRSVFNKYVNDDMELNEREKESFKIGLEAQKGFTPSYYFSKAAWRSSASYVGAYCPKEVLPPAFDKARSSFKP